MKPEAQEGLKSFVLKTVVQKVRAITRTASLIVQWEALELVQNYYKSLSWHANLE